MSEPIFSSERLISSKHVLVAAREWLARPLCWRRGTWGSSYGACLVGALNLAGCGATTVMTYPEYPVATIYLNKALTERMTISSYFHNYTGRDRLVAWNDAPGRTVVEVLALYDCAIEMIDADIAAARAQTHVTEHDLAVAGD